MTKPRMIRSREGDNKINYSLQAAARAKKSGNLTFHQRLRLCSVTYIIDPQAGVALRF